MGERIEEQPFDDRHNTEPRYPDPDVTPWGPGSMGVPDEGIPLGFELPERGKSQSYGYVPMIAVSTGLVWRFSPGQELQDLGRITPDAVASMSELDLRVILAHLDSAAHTIQIELGRR